MKSTIFHLIFLMVLLCANTATAQVIKGTVIDANTKAVLQRATVYQDGTTNVAFTDDQGFFQLDLKGLKKALLVRFVGYETKRIENPMQLVNQTTTISLTIDAVALEEVVIGKQHNFTRRQMLQAFKREFLGTSKAALSCTIENEKDLMFTYDVGEQKLTATSKQPLKIINKYLEYEMMFDLKEFAVYFWNKRNLERTTVATMYFDGYSYYIDRSKRNRAEKKRYESYLGSIPHFVHALAYDKMDEQKWKLIVDGKIVNPKEYFEITDTLQVKKVMELKKPQKIIRGINSEDMLNRFKIMNKDATVDSNGVVRMPTFYTPFYDGKLQSRMEFKEPAVYVDVNGNFMPLSGVMFAGHMGDLRAADLLPLDYLNTIKDRAVTKENQ